MKEETSLVKDLNHAQANYKMKCHRIYAWIKFSTALGMGNTFMLLFKSLSSLANFRIGSLLELLNKLHVQSKNH